MQEGSVQGGSSQHYQRPHERSDAVKIQSTSGESKARMEEYKDRTEADRSELQAKWESMARQAVCFPKPITNPKTTKSKCKEAKETGNPETEDEVEDCETGGKESSVADGEERTPQSLSHMKGEPEASFPKMEEALRGVHGGVLPTVVGAAAGADEGTTKPQRRALSKAGRSTDFGKRSRGRRECGEASGDLRGGNLHPCDVLLAFRRKCQQEVKMCWTRSGNR